MWNFSLYFFTYFTFSHSLSLSLLLVVFVSLAHGLCALFNHVQRHAYNRVDEWKNAEFYMPCLPVCLILIEKLHAFEFKNKWEHKCDSPPAEIKRLTVYENVPSFMATILQQIRQLKDMWMTVFMKYTKFSSSACQLSVCQSLSANCLSFSNTFKQVNEKTWVQVLYLWNP